MGAFDDLIPKQPAGGGSFKGAFDDLVAAPVAPTPVELGQVDSFGRAARQALGATGNVFGRALSAPAVLADAVANLFRATPSYPLSDAAFSTLVDPATRSAQASQFGPGEKPAIVGQTVGGLVGMGPSIALGGGATSGVKDLVVRAGERAAPAVAKLFGEGMLSAAPAVAGMQEQSAQALMGQGVSESVARQAAAKEAAVNALGMALPPAAPGRLLTRMGQGAVANVASNKAAQNASNSVLLDNGYGDLVKPPELLSEEDTPAAALGALFAAVLGKRAPPTAPSRGALGYVDRPEITLAPDVEIPRAPVETSSVPAQAAKQVTDRLFGVPDGAPEAPYDLTLVPRKTEMPTSAPDETLAPRAPDWTLEGDAPPAQPKPMTVAEQVAQDDLAATIRQRKEAEDAFALANRRQEQADRDLRREGAIDQDYQGGDAAYQQGEPTRTITLFEGQLPIRIEGVSDDGKTTFFTYQAPDGSIQRASGETSKVSEKVIPNNQRLAQDFNERAVDPTVGSWKGGPRPANARAGEFVGRDTMESEKMPARSTDRIAGDTSAGRAEPYDPTIRDARPPGGDSTVMPREGGPVVPREPTPQGRTFDQPPPREVPPAPDNLLGDNGKRSLENRTQPRTEDLGAAGSREEYLNNVAKLGDRLQDGDVVRDPETDVSWTIRKRTTSRGIDVVEFESESGRNTFMYNRDANGSLRISGDPVLSRNLEVRSKVDANPNRLPSPDMEVPSTAARTVERTNNGPGSRGFTEGRSNPTGGAINVGGDGAARTAGETYRQRGERMDQQNAANAVSNYSRNDLGRDPNTKVGRTDTAAEPPPRMSEETRKSRLAELKKQVDEAEAQYAKLEKTAANKKAKQETREGAVKQMKALRKTIDALKFKAGELSPPKSEAAAARPEQPQQPQQPELVQQTTVQAEQPKTPNRENLPGSDMLVRIRKDGGINSNLARELIGANGFALNNRLPGLSKKTGMGLDDLVTWLVDNNHITRADFDEAVRTGKGGEHEAALEFLRDAIFKKEGAGRRIDTGDADFQAQARQRERGELESWAKENGIDPNGKTDEQLYNEVRAKVDQLESTARSDYDDLRPGERPAVDEAVPDVPLAKDELDAAAGRKLTDEEFLRELGATDEEISRLKGESGGNEQPAADSVLRGGEGESGRGQPESPRADEVRPESGKDGQRDSADAGDGFKLESPTESELRLRAERERADAAERSRVENAPPAGDFKLTGSDSPADQARAQGQRELDTTGQPFDLDNIEKKTSEASRQEAEDREEMRSFFRRYVDSLIDGKMSINDAKGAVDDAVRMGIVTRKEREKFLASLTDEATNYNLSLGHDRARAMLREIVKRMDGIKSDGSMPESTAAANDLQRGMQDRRAEREARREAEGDGITKLFGGGPDWPEIKKMVKAIRDVLFDQSPAEQSFRKDIADALTAPFQGKGVREAVARSLGFIMWSDASVTANVGRARNSAVIQKVARMFADNIRGEGRVGETFEHEYEAHYRRAVNRLTELGNNLSPEDWKMVERKLMNRKSIQGNSAIDTAAREIAKLLDQEHVRLREAGVDIGQQKDYFPRVYSAEKMLGVKQEQFVRAAAKAFQIDGATPEQARAQADDWLNAMLAKGMDIPEIPFTNLSSDLPSKNFAKARQISMKAFKESGLADFTIDDTYSVLSNYFRRTAKRAAFDSRFGGTDYWVNRNGKLQWVDKLKPGEQAVGGRTRTFSKWQQMRDELVAEGNADLTGWMEQRILSMSGQSAANAGNAARMTGSVLGMVTVVDFLRRALLSSLGEPIQVYNRTAAQGQVTAAWNSVKTFGEGVKDLVDHIAPFLGQDWRTASRAEQYRIAEMVGALLNDKVTGLQDAMRADVGGELNPGSRTERVAQGLSARAMKATGLHQWTNGNIVSSVSVGIPFIKAMVNDAAGGSKRAEYELTRLGLRVEDAKAMGEMLDGKSIDDIVTAAGGGDKAAREFLGALNRFSRQTFMQATAADKPALSKHPLGRVAYGLQSWMYSYWYNVTKADIKQTYEALTGQGYTATERAGMVAAPIISTAATYIMASQLVSLLRELYSGKDKDKEREEKNQKAEVMGIKVSTLRDLSQSGKLGLLDVPVNMLVGARYGRDPGSVVSGPALGLPIKAMTETSKLLSDKNSDKTNFQERKAADALYYMTIDPLLATAAALAKVPYLPSFLSQRDELRAKFTDTLAGEKQAGKGGGGALALP
jgi:hypothetical protein